MNTTGLFGHWNNKLTHSNLFFILFFCDFILYYFSILLIIMFHSLPRLNVNRTCLLWVKAAKASQAENSWAILFNDFPTALLAWPLLIDHYTLTCYLDEKIPGCCKQYFLIADIYNSFYEFRWLPFFFDLTNLLFLFFSSFSCT